VDSDNIFYSERIQIRCTPRQKKMAEEIARKFNISVNEAWRISVEGSYIAVFPKTV
jgi:hypothetical protein